MLQTGFYTLTSAAPAAIYFDTPDTADVIFILAAFAAELRFLRGFLVVPLPLFYVYYSTYY